MVRKGAGRPKLPTPLIIHRMRVRGTLAGAIQIRGEDAPEVAKLMLTRHAELMSVPSVFPVDVVIEMDRLCAPVSQRLTNPRGRKIDMPPVDPLSLGLIDAWYLVAERGYEACDFLAQHFGAKLDVTGLGRPNALWLWCAMLDGLLVARNHPDYATDPIAAYRAAGLCA